MGNRHNNWLHSDNFSATLQLQDCAFTPLSVTAMFNIISNEFCCKKITASNSVTTDTIIMSVGLIDRFKLLPKPFSRTYGVK